MMATTIYVYLPDEAVPCWRPVEAISVGDDRYEIVSLAPDAEIEHWEFGRGSIVRCERRRLGQADVLMAVERA